MRSVNCMCLCAGALLLLTLLAVPTAHGVSIRTLARRVPVSVLSTSNCTALNCTTGAYCNTGVSPSVCEPCEAGRFRFAPGDNATSTTSLCEECGRGTYSSTGAARCLDCPVGRYNEVNGSSHCLLCTNGSNPERASQKYSHCFQCDVGQGWSGFREVCVTCGVGYYSTAAMSACERCSVGQEPANPNDEGNVRCADCPAGGYRNTTVPSNDFGLCNACPSGKSSDTGASTCADCLVGTFAADTGVLCANCSAGRFGNTSRATRCFSCLSGNYQASAGRSACDACPLGRFINESAAQGCNGCAAGSFANTTGSTVCHLCPAGRFGGAVAATSLTDGCTTCPVGQTSSQGTTFCVICSAGRYAEDNQCYDCPLGTFRVGPGGAGVTACGDCADGYASQNYTIIPGELPSHSGTGATMCHACGSGRYENGSNIACLQCPAGKFRASPLASGVTACLDCSTSGEYALVGATSCQLCPAGSIALSDFTDCLLCPPGRFGNTSGLVSNPAGFDDRDDCFLCPEGTVSRHALDLQLSNESLARLSEMLVGSEWNESVPLGWGATDCVACSTGSFEIGRRRCLQCPAGRVNATVLASDRALTAQFSTVTADSRSVTAFPVWDDGIGVWNVSVLCGGCPAPLTGNHLPPLPHNPASKLALLGFPDYTERSAPFPSGNNGSDACVNCTYGHYYNSSAGLCFVCPVGRFAPTEGSATIAGCQICPDGTYSAAGSSVCEDCAAGSYVPFPNDQGGLACLECPRGRFNNLINRQGNSTTACTACPNGWIAARTGQNRCFQCPTGTFEENSRNCLPCGSGTYQPFEGRRGETSCLQCQNGSVSDIAAPACVSCGYGAYEVVGDNDCANCQAGFFQPSPEATVCVQCGQSGHPDRSVAKAQSCFSCLPGQLVNASSPIGCSPCPAGRYSGNFTRGGRGGDFTSCVAAPLGWYANGTNMFILGLGGASAVGDTGVEGTDGTSLWDDIEGYYGSTQAFKCPLGTFANTSGQSFCHSCPSGRFFNVSEPWAVDHPFGGAQNDSLCAACSVGTYGAGTSCEICPAGAYQGAAVGGFCEACGAGTFSNATGSEECFVCPPGSIAVSGVTVCAECAVASYSAGGNGPVASRDTCMLCPKGFVTAATGATHVDNCTACPAGQTTAAAGSSVCVDCAPGFFSDNSTACEPCPDGTFANSSGQSACVDCGYGFVSTVGAINCTACGEGTYNELLRASACVNCSAGFASNRTGAAANNVSVCVACAKGRFSKEQSSQCTLCPPGSATNFLGATRCTECTPGRAFAGTGSGECDQCPKGYIAPVSSMSACVLCGLNTYNSVQGRSVCIDCPVGTYSITDDCTDSSSCCQPCPPGHRTPDTGVSRCELCEAGKFSDDWGVSACADCAGGSFASEGATQCTPCHSGNYSFQASGLCVEYCGSPDLGSGAAPDVATQSCALCDFGKFYQVYNYDPTSDTVSAPVNTTTEAQYGIDPLFTRELCTDCVAGKFAGDRGDTVCVNCFAGTKSEAGARQCSPDLTGDQEAETNPVTLEEVIIGLCFFLVGLFLFLWYLRAKNCPLCCLKKRKAVDSSKDRYLAARLQDIEMQERLAQERLADGGMDSAIADGGDMKAARSLYEEEQAKLRMTLAQATAPAYTSNKSAKKKKKKKHKRADGIEENYRGRGLMNPELYKYYRSRRKPDAERLANDINEERDSAYREDIAKERMTLQQYARPKGTNTRNGDKKKKKKKAKRPEQKEAAFPPPADDVMSDGQDDDWLEDISDESVEMSQMTNRDSEVAGDESEPGIDDLFLPHVGQ